MVSVIIPIYNTEKYLQKCLTSIQYQSYSDIEVILIDDGSTDNSKYIALGYTKKDARFKLFSQANSGVSKARNFGIKKSQGEYVLFVDSDDWLEQNMIEKLVGNIESFNVDISCCQYDKGLYYFEKTTSIWDQEKSIEEFLIHKSLNGSLVNKLFKKNLLANITLDDSIKYGEDALFFWKVLLKTKNISVSPDILYHVTLHNDSASGGGSYKKIRKDCIYVWEEVVRDAEHLGEHFHNLAKAQLSNMAFFSLYEMLYYEYEDIEHEKCYKNVLRRTIKDMSNADFIPRSEKILAKIFLLNTSFGKLIMHLKKKFL